MILMIYKSPFKWVLLFCLIFFWFNFFTYFLSDWTMAAVPVSLMHHSGLQIPTQMMSQMLPACSLNSSMLSMNVPSVAITGSLRLGFCAKKILSIFSETDTTMTRAKNWAICKLQLLNHKIDQYTYFAQFPTAKCITFFKCKLYHPRIEVLRNCSAIFFSFSCDR